MSFDYNPGITTNRDQVRLYIGDTDSTNPQLQDEEIAFFLVQEPNTLEAAIIAAEAIAARYARQVDISLDGGVRQSLMQLQISYEKLADRLRRRTARRGLSPYVGGQSQSDKDSYNTDTTLVPHVFARPMETEPGTENTQPQYPNVSPFPY